MELQGERLIPADLQRTWSALNDPDTLKACIAGCESLERTGDHSFKSVVAVKVGPVNARFNGKLEITNLQPPRGYTINFEGQGGAAGFGRGNAKVNLSPALEGSGCELSYTAHAQVGGKIAQVGQRLVDGVAKSMAEDFFRRFEEEMQRRYPQQVAADAALESAAVAPPPTGKRMPVWVWGVFALVVVVALLLLIRR